MSTRTKPFVVAAIEGSEAATEAQDYRQDNQSVIVRDVQAKRLPIGNKVKRTGLVSACIWLPLQITLSKSCVVRVIRKSD